MSAAGAVRYHNGGTRTPHVGNSGVLNCLRTWRLCVFVTDPRRFLDEKGLDHRAGGLHNHSKDGRAPEVLKLQGGDAARAAEQETESEEPDGPL